MCCEICINLHKSLLHKGDTYHYSRLFIYPLSCGHKDMFLDVVICHILLAEAKGFHTIF